MFYLLDLERSISTGRTFFWRANKRGYTDEITEAGLYTEKQAAEIVQADINKRTIMIEEKAVNDLMNEYF